jgi:hypothetical protein
VGLAHRVRLRKRGRGKPASHTRDGGPSDENAAIVASCAASWFIACAPDALGAGDAVRGNTLFHTTYACTDCHGVRPGCLVHVRRRARGWGQQAALVHVQRQCGERAGERADHPVPECRRQFRCASDDERDRGRQRNSRVQRLHSRQSFVHFSDGSGRSGTIPLKRLLGNVTCAVGTTPSTNADFGFSGNWFYAAASGQGFVIEVNPGTPFFFLTWYTYGRPGRQRESRGNAGSPARPASHRAHGRLRRRSSRPPAMCSNR